MSIADNVIVDVSYVAAGITAVVAALALSMRFASRKIAVLDLISDNGFALYVLHYGFVVWLQYALLKYNIFVGLKWAIVFGGALALSWVAVLLFQQIGNVVWVKQRA
jgi:surface polysaccharide O-acyltransferase-like enzyme